MHDFQRVNKLIPLKILLCIFCLLFYGLLNLNSVSSRSAGSQVPFCEEWCTSNEMRQAWRFLKENEVFSVAARVPLDYRHLGPGVEWTGKKISSGREIFNSVGKGKTYDMGSCKLLGHLVSINHTSHGLGCYCWCVCLCIMFNGHPDWVEAVIKMDQRKEVKELNLEVISVWKKTNPNICRSWALRNLVISHASRESPGQCQLSHFKVKSILSQTRGSALNGSSMIYTSIFLPLLI